MDRIGGVLRQVKAVNDASPSQNAGGVSAYQQNLAKPVEQSTKWYKGDQPTYAEAVGRIWQISQQDPERGRKLQSDFQMRIKDPTSQYYQAYSGVTNKAVSNLAGYGIDASNINAFKQANPDWNSYLIYNTTTNTPQKPGKKASTAEKIAYEIYQYDRADADTQSMKKEWLALQDELSYKATRKDRNYSDDEIINSVDWSKYPTLRKMNESLAPGKTLMELNEGTDYSADNMRGVIWNARNGRIGGNLNNALAHSALGDGVVWQNDPGIKAKLNWNDPTTYSPYEVGMTMDENVGMYFGVYEINQDTLNQIRQTLDPNDETALKMFEKASNAWNTTQKAEAELEDLYDKVNKMLKSGKSEEYILNRVNNLLGKKEYATLKAMDDSIQNGSGLLQTTRAVPYKRQEFEQQIKNWFSEQKASAADLAANGLNRSSDSVSSVRAARERDQQTRDALSIFDDDATPEETAAFTGYSGSQDAAKETLAAAKEEALNPKGTGNAPTVAEIAQRQTGAVTKNYIEQTTSVYKSINDFDDTLKSLDEAENAKADLSKRLGNLIYYGRTPDEFFDVTVDGNKYRVHMTEDMSEIKGIDNINNPDVPTAVYSSYGLYDSPDQWDEDTRVWDYVENSKELADFKTSYPETKKLYDEANSAEPDEATMQMIKAYRSAEIQAEDANKYISENQEQYDKDVASYQNANQRMEAHIQNLRDSGADTTDIEVAQAVMAGLSDFTDYEATVWNQYNPSYAYTEMLANGKSREDVLKQAETDHTEAIECIKDIEWLKKYISDHDIKLSDDVMKNMDRRLAKHQRDIQDYEFFRTQWMKDFDSVAEAGMKAEYESRQRKGVLGNSLPFDNMTQEQYYASIANDEFEQDYYGPGSLVRKSAGMSSLMTDDERKTWYYLNEKDKENGTQKADEYLSFMMDPTYGVLWTRKREATEGMAQEMTSSNFGGFMAANTASVMLSPYNALASGAMWAYNKVTGSEFNPNSPFLTFSHFRNKTREQSAEEILHTFGEKVVDPKTGKTTYKETTLSKVAQGGYEILTNRLDSAMNAAAFGWMFSGVGNEMLREFLSAAPMGASAAMEAAARAKERGASDTQAYVIATATFFAETGTEAISLENMSEALNIGEEMSTGTFKEFAINWLRKGGISEAFGESLNDIIENIADERVMGELSEHAKLVEQYRMDNPGISVSEAEAMARRDEINGVLRTALISYLSPGLDVFQTAKGRYNHYKGKTIEWNKANPDQKKTLRDIRKEELQQNKETRDAEKEEQKKRDARPVEEMGEIDYEALGEKTGANAEIAKQQEAENAEKKKRADTFTVDFEILGSGKGGDRSAQNTAISAVLDEQHTAESRDESDAVAGLLHDVLGENRDAVNEVEDLMVGANSANGNIPFETIKQGIRYAALSENSESRRVMQSDEYQKATPALKAAMLAKAAQNDMGNTTLNDGMNQRVHDFRVARIEADLTANPDQATTKITQETVDAAEANAIQKEGNTLDAQRKLDNQRAVEKAAFEAARTAGLYSDAKTHEAKLNEAGKQVEVRKSYETGLEAAKRDEQAAREKAEKLKQQRKADLRQQAEQMVRDIDQQRAQAAEEARIAAEQEAQAKAEQQAVQQSNENALNADIDTLIEQRYPNATEEQKAHVREMVKQVYQQMQQEVSGITVDELLNRQKVLNRISKKYGFNVDVRDTTEGGKTFFSDGYFDRETNTLVLDTSTTIQQAMYKILGHELTHIAEQSNTYGELADALLRDAYGDDFTFDSVLKQMESGDFSSQLAQDVLAKKQTYDKTLKKNHSYKYMLEEVVADRMGDILNGDQELINRLAEKEPGVIRRIIDSIKNFLKKNKNVQGEWQTESQRIVSMLETALKDAKGQKEGEGKRYKLQSKTTVKPLVTDDQGNSIATELPGGTVSLNTEDRRHSLASFNPEERAKVKQALIDSGRFTTEAVDKYLNDAMSIASMIAADRTRLDYEADPGKTMLKPNAEYVKTLDASTLCAKRLLYQGTFDAIQHALPNTPLMPEDLIDLSNLMREMGYETPCGICYVESRRRQLGKFTEQWLESYEGEYKPTIDEVTTSDGLEKLRTEHPQAYQDFITAMNKKGTMNPKVVQLRTDYRGEIRDMTPGQIQKVKDIGGLRIQSFSDFETPHLLDMMQAVMDMSAKGLTAQAYTKVPNFPWAFGDTGIKINLSLIGKGTGLDANGNLVFDDVEGMPFEEAMKLRDRYSQNVGTILVGINDDHILAAMADDRIDFIIPFHKSGWSKTELERMPVLNGYDDYTDSQNEKAIVGRDKKGNYKTESLDKSKRVNFQPVGENGYWDFTKTGKENAEAYLKMCAEDKRLPKFSQFLVDNGDGSFSLQPDGSTDGYWKTLIDFKMYDNDGNGAPQQEVTPNVNMTEAQRILNDYSLDRNGITRESNNDLPVAQPVVDRYVEEYKAKHPLDENKKRYNLPSDKYLEQTIRHYLENGGSMSTGEPQGPQRQFGSQTAQRSDVLSDLTLQYLREHSSYTPDTNDAELARAIQWIDKNKNDNDPDGYQTSLEKIMSNGFNYRTKDGQARTIAVLGMAAAKNDIVSQIAIADKYNKEGTALGQALQARKLFRLMTPEGRIASMRKMLSNAQDEINRKGSNIQLEFSNWIYQAAAAATEEGDYEKVRQAALNELAEQIPANWRDRVRSLRMLAMLANPRTHIRNIVGNMLFMPAVSIKNKLGAIGEIITKQEERTKTLSLVLPKEIKIFSKELANKNKGLLTGEAKYNEAIRIAKAQHKLGKALDWASEKNSNWLEKEDWLFLKGHFARSFGGWMQANGYTVEQVQNDQALMEKGLEYAVQEAQKATYRDFNKTAAVLNEVSRKGGLSGFIVDAALPFKKTPANILRRGIEYSPVGIVKALTTDMYHMKQYMDYQNGKLSVLPEKAMSPNQVIDDICSGLSGTAIMALGFLLAGTGAVSCGLDDDDKFDKEQGAQEYAVNPGQAANTILGWLGIPKIFGEDVTYTMDWAAPMSMPFFVGAAVRNMQMEEGDVDIEGVLNAMGAITEPVFNLSMLDGINTLFKTSSYDDTNPITQIGAKIGMNYVSSYVPSVLGAISRTFFDDKQRKSFVEQGKNKGIMGTIRSTLEQMQNKVPVLAQQNIAARDIWGIEKTSTFIERLFENFISPGYIEHVEEDPLINEMSRVYEVTGGNVTDIMPDDPPKSIEFTRGGEKQKNVLTDKEWDRYKEVRGQVAFNELNELFNNRDYQNAMPSAQKTMIHNVWNHADKLAKADVWPEYDAGETQSVTAITKTSKIDSYKTEIAKALRAEDYDAYDAMVEAMYEEYDDVSDADSAIREKVGNTFRDEWKKAYRDNDYVRMNEIEDLLDYTGYDFNIYGKNGWQEKVDEKYGT